MDIQFKDGLAWIEFKAGLVGNRINGNGGNRVKCNDRFDSVCRKRLKS